jgi:hypothetical protein
MRLDVARERVVEVAGLRVQVRYWDPTLTLSLASRGRNCTEIISDSTTLASFSFDDA